MQKILVVSQTTGEILTAISECKKSQPSKEKYVGEITKSPLLSFQAQILNII